jgi:hypothetical protein
VSSQITDGVNGVLLSPGGRDEQAQQDADAAFGRAILGLLRDPQQRARLGKAAAKRSRERCSPRAIEQKIGDSFVQAQEHAAACGLRPAVSRPKPMQWYTTFQHFRPWTTFMTGVYLFGHLRPAKKKAPTKARLHPQFGS